MTTMLNRLVRVLAPFVTGQEFDRLARTHQMPLVTGVRAVLGELCVPDEAMVEAAYAAVERDDRWSIEDADDFQRAWLAALGVVEQEPGP